MAKILIIGCGAIGYQLATTLAESGHTVTGIKRNPPPYGYEKFTILPADITSPTDLDKLDNDYEHIFFIVAADGRNLTSYQSIYHVGIDNLLKHFAHTGCHAPWIFVSSTSVYGQTLGEWVDENSPTLPDKTTSQIIVHAEYTLMAQNPANVIVRFSGIYGPGREHLISTARHSPVVQQQPPYYTNRIHQRDCVGVLAFLLEQRLLGVNLEQCYLASDDNPAPMWDVVSWMTSQLQCAPPTAKITSVDSDKNKRCRNDRLKRLGYKFIYPDFMAGYSELLANYK